MPTVRQNLIFGMGNPLLDISAHVDAAFLAKYGLEENNAILADDKHLAMFDEMSKMSGVEYIAGGATQNSFRILSWMVGKEKEAGSFIGCVGKDEYGQRLADNMGAAGVKVAYQVTEKVKTGTCAVCVNGEHGKHRSLVAHLAAANEYTKDHLEQPDNLALMKGADFYYISGFFLTVCPDAMLMVGKHAAEMNKTFVCNLSAPFICEFFKDQQMSVMPYVDILITNELEAVKFAEVHNFGTKDHSEICKKLAQLEGKVNTKRPRIAIVTQGPEAVLVAQADGTLTTYDVPKLDQNKLVDTNGAGDAWVGGFLSAWIQEKGMAESVRAGNWAAQVVIQRSGCTYPETCHFV